LERSGIVFGRPSLRQLGKGMLVEARDDAIRARHDGEYSYLRRLYFIATAPLYRFARWYGQLRAADSSSNYSLETKRKVKA
jgi:hypothetical protein